MDAKVTWKQGMAFSAVGDSGYEVALDTEKEHGGSDKGVRPMEMLLLGLGGCTGMDVVSILGKKRQTLTDFQILIHADRAAEHPQVYTKITLEYVVTGRALDPAAVNRAVELSETKYCSAMAMLRKTAEIATKITIKEA